MNWLGEYIPHYSKLISPMTDLLSPKKAYRWTKEAQESLEKAKVAFCNHLPLSRLDPSLPFILQTDASAKGMGAVLMQQETKGKRRIISYASAKFSSTKARYHCNEQECLAIIWAIKRYRAHLEDQRFILRTDSKTLTWLKNQKDTRAKLTRWHLLLSEYTFDIEHCPGKENELPDALSRFPNTEDSAPIEPDPERMALPLPCINEETSRRTLPTLHTVHVPSLFEDIFSAQQEDPEISQQISKWLEKKNQVGLTPEEEHFIQDHRVDERGFWRRSRDNKGWLLLAPKLLRQRIIWEFHDAPRR